MTRTEHPHDAASLAAQAREARAAIDDLIEYLDEAVDVQWDPSPIPKPREDTTQRASGGHGDPTSAVALDDRRGEVRSAFVAGSQALDVATIQARATRRRIEEALDRWAGHDRT